MTGDNKVAEGCVVVRASSNSDGSQGDTVVADWYQIAYSLAPPVWVRLGASGVPRKRRYGAWMGRAFKLLARLKNL